MWKVVKNGIEKFKERGVLLRCEGNFYKSVRERVGRS